MTACRRWSRKTSSACTAAIACVVTGSGWRWAVARWQDLTFSEITNPATQAKVVHRTQPYWLLDAMARYQFNDRLLATVNVNDLLDKRYYMIFNWYSTYTWGQPRNVRLTLNYSF